MEKRLSSETIYLAVLYDEEEEPQNFWANTSSNTILDDFVNHRKIDASEKLDGRLRTAVHIRYCLLCQDCKSEACEVMEYRLNYNGIMKKQ